MGQLSTQICKHDVHKIDVRLSRNGLFDAVRNDVDMFVCIMSRT